MSKQTQGSMILVAALAGGFGFVAFVGLMVVGGFAVSPAAFLAIVVAAAAAIFLFAGFHKTNDTPALSVREHRSLTPSSDGKLGDRTVEAGKAGVAPGSAGVKPGSALSSPARGPADYPAESGRNAPAAAGAGAVADVANAHADDFGSTPFEAPHTTEGPKKDAENREAEPNRDPAPATTGRADATAGSAADSAASRPAETAHDGEAAQEQTIVGTEPRRLDSPREGGADDLKEIKGIGPKLEEMLNRMGIYHYDQIAHWTDGELAWADESIEGFRGRASRDDWRGQARDLSAS